MNTYIFEYKGRYVNEVCALKTKANTLAAALQEYKNLLGADTLLKVFENNVLIYMDGHGLYF